MNQKTKTIIFIAVPLLILGFLIFSHFLKGSNGDLMRAKTDYQFTSVELNRKFLKNDSVSNAIYGNKVIELTGVVANVKNSDAHGVIVTFDDPVMGIKCVMDSAYKEFPKDFGIGSEVNIKGICIGSDQLIGVMMNHCILLESKKTTL